MAITPGKFLGLGRHFGLVLGFRFLVGVSGVAGKRRAVPLPGTECSSPLVLRERAKVLLAWSFSELNSSA